MNSFKAFLLAAFCVLCSAAFAQAPYVQPMQYRHYSIPYQVNIGTGQVKLTNPSAFLELGDSLNSKKGLLFPRGNKDSVLNPSKGLVIFDMPSSKLKLYDGTNWVDIGGGTSGFLTGSGTAGRLPVWSGSGALATSQVYDNGTNVGIGVAPHAVYKLWVNGHGYFMGNIGALAGVHTGANWGVTIDSNGYFRYAPQTVNDTTVIATKWFVNHRDDSLLSLIDSANYIDGSRVSTSLVPELAGQVPNVFTVKDMLEYIMYPALPPIGSLSITYGGSTYPNLSLEYMAAGADLSVTLNWSAGRQSNTAALQSVEVDGDMQTFSQPAQNASVTGTVAKLLPRNTNKLYHMNVLTTDGKMAFGNVNVFWYSKRYWGFANGTNPSDAAIRSGASEFINDRTQAQTGAYSPTGSQYYFIAFPEAYDASNFSQIWIGGINQTDAFTRTVRSFTNAGGDVRNYIVYISKNPTAGSVSHEIK
ncbi:MAG: hypothetical protein EOO14_00370 [Chitinophagaceae bacterium]|nr:MAG: hypothetical protein EOO14_00370 [Chitinophagaceae bacterium]